MATLIQIRRDSAANWTTNNPVLALGEMAYSTDDQKLKVGDGSSDWTSLSYINALPSEITAEISSAIDGVIDAAPGTLDTLNELAAAINDDASFYTTITNSISSSIDALDTDDIEEGATNLYFTDARAQSALSGLYDPAGSAATAESNANTYTDGEISSLDSSLKTYADTAESDAIASANSYTDGRETAITSAYEAYADQAESDAISASATDATTKANTAESNAKSYTDDLVGDATVDGTLGNTVADRIASAVADLVDSAPGTLDTLNELAAALGDDPNFATSIATTISTGDSNTLSSAQSYADQAEADAIATAAADATAKADAALASAQTYADQAETDAVTTANAYTDTRETAITTAYQTYADTAESDAVATAAADATSKANTAEANANSYTDTEIANLIGGAPELLNTLDEIAAAIADDENFSTTVVSDIAQGLTDAKAYTDTRETAITTAYQSYADTAEADAISTAASDATSKANTAESNANTYTDNSINALDTDAIEEGTSNLYFTNSRAQDATPGRVTASSTKPGTPSNGDGWVDIDTGSLYVYINDGDSSQWVQV